MTSVQAMRLKRRGQLPGSMVRSYEAHRRFASVLVTFALALLMVISLFVFMVVAGRVALDVFLYPALIAITGLNLATFYCGLRLMLGESMAESAMRESASRNKIKPEKTASVMRLVLTLMAVLTVVGSGAIMLAGSVVLGVLFKLSTLFGISAVFAGIATIALLGVITLTWRPTKMSMTFLHDQFDRDALFRYRNHC